MTLSESWSTQARYARPTRWLITTGALVVLTACQGVSTHQAVAKKPQVEPDWWSDRVMSGEDHLREAIFKACPKQGLLSNEKCVKAKIVESFAEQNDAGMRCADENDPGRLFMCVVNFTVAKRIYGTMGVDPQGGIDWDDSFESVNGLQRLMASRLTAACPGISDADCVARELATMLAMPPDEARYCVRTTDVTDAVRCGTGLVMLDTYGTAQRYVSA